MAKPMTAAWRCALGILKTRKGQTSGRTRGTRLITYVFEDTEFSKDDLALLRGSKQVEINELAVVVREADAPRLYSELRAK